MGKRKVKEAGRGAERASNARAVAAAHPVEGSMKEEVALVRHGAHLDVTQKWTMSGTLGSEFTITFRLDDAAQKPRTRFPTKACVRRTHTAQW